VSHLTLGNCALSLTISGYTPRPDQKQPTSAPTLPRENALLKK
jgi:hypothetical protein